MVTSPRGRGEQLHRGALAARGDVLFFVHADVDVPPHTGDAIHGALRSRDIVGGNFLLRFEPETRAARLFACANDLRRRWLAIYYGDSAIS